MDCISDAFKRSIMEKSLDSKNINQMGKIILGLNMIGC